MIFNIYLEYYELRYINAKKNYVHGFLNEVNIIY